MVERDFKPGLSLYVHAKFCGCKYFSFLKKIFNVIGLIENHW